MNQIESVWDLFCELVTSQAPRGDKSAKKIILEHFMATQNQRPEFLYHLILIYFRERKFLKVDQLLDQFFLHKINSSIYRQYRLPQILMIKLRLFYNIKAKYAKGVECADYLVEIVENSEGSEDRHGVTNLTVQRLLLDKQEKMSAYLMQAGIAYSIFSDSSECKMYFKVKMMKKKALDLFQ